MQRFERRVQQKEENVDKKADALEKKESVLSAREGELAKQRSEIAKLNEQRIQELERISGLTSEQAKDYLLKIVEDEVKHESAVMIKDMEARAKRGGGQEGQRICGDCHSEMRSRSCGGGHHIRCPASQR